MVKLLRWIILVASVALFLVCLTLDGFYIDRPGASAAQAASELLVTGWLGLLAGIIAWLANPLLLAGWVLFALRQDGIALGLGLAALFCALSFLSVETVLDSDAGYFKVIEYGLGYWLWVASTAVITLGAGLAITGLVPGSRSRISATFTDDSV
jgi:hypothetical protein